MFVLGVPLYTYWRLRSKTGDIGAGDQRALQTYAFLFADYHVPA